jgi:hypothetical protein
MSIEEFISGKQKIEQGIRDTLCEKGITDPNIIWNNGRPLVSPQTMTSIPLEVAVPGRRVLMFLSYEVVAECHTRPEGIMPWIISKLTS